jgi:hypothetical protein
MDMYRGNLSPHNPDVMGFSNQLTLFFWPVLAFYGMGHLVVF